VEPAPVTGRKAALRVVLVLLGLPLVVAGIEAASFYARNRSNGALVSSGGQREYHLYVPRTYDPTKPTPLVISLHAAALWGVAQMETSRWNEAADAHGFLVVYPSGMGGGGPRVWRVTRGPGLARDVRFISDLIDTLEAAYNIDPARIYANGLSNGGGMSFVLSCTLSDRIAAVGLVAAAQTLPWSWCTDRRPVPMIAFHGTADPMIPYEGGKSPIATDVFPSIPIWAKSWARRNGCGTKPVESPVAAGVTRTEYTDCTDGAAVRLYTVQGGGHTWPGGAPLPEWYVGPNSNGVDATREMWEFFREHPLRIREPARGMRAPARRRTGS
jgi:polyhydroxybutyrate depolymerase